MPLLFVIVMEGLISFLDYAIADDTIKGLGRKECEVNHIFFANGVMIFSSATSKTLHNIEKTLMDFSKASGLEVNLTKSKVFFFSKSTPGSFKKNLKFKEGSLLVKYLVSPLAS